MKKLLKKLLVPLLNNRQLATIAHRLLDCGIPVFMLHRIAQNDQPDSGKTDPAHLRLCLEYLKKNDYTFISLSQLLSTLKNKRPMPYKPVVFTMDDGYIDQAEIAAPIFLEYGCPLTFFVITGLLDQHIWPWDAKVSWVIESSDVMPDEYSTIIKILDLTIDENTSKRTFRRSIQNALKRIDADVIPDILLQLANDANIDIPDKPPASYQPMNWEMARKLEKQGIRFAPHSVSHNILSRLSQKTMEDEIRQSWLTISNELDNPLNVFCYPTGRTIDFGPREIEALKKAHYQGAISTTPNFVMNNSHSEEQIFSLPRLALPDNMTDFIQYCSWAECVRSRKYTTPEQSV